MRLHLVQASRKRPEQSRTFGYLANSSQWLTVYKERELPNARPASRRRECAWIGQKREAGCDVRLRP
jgi:hypothetical protein